MAPSAEAQAQTQRVDLSHSWPLGQEPLQVLTWLYPGLLCSIILVLEWESLPTLTVLPRCLLEYGICPGDDSKAGSLVILGRHALMPSGILLLLQ